VFLRVFSRYEVGIAAELKRFTRCGSGFCFFQMRSTVAGLAFWLAAIVRTLQRVASFGTIVIVVTMMAASLAAGICLGRPLRGRSEISPARLEIELFDGAVQLCL